MLGKGKTIRGFIAGVLSGSLIACAFALLAPLQWFTVSCFWFWTLNTGHETQFLGGCFMALGTMIGDASGSFFKRRLGIESGKQFFPDTIVFLVFALLFAYPFVSSSLWSLENMAFLFGLTIILHPGTNFIANRLGLKKVPW